MFANLNEKLNKSTASVVSKNTEEKKQEPMPDPQSEPPSAYPEIKMPAIIADLAEPEEPKPQETKKKAKKKRIPNLPVKAPEQPIPPPIQANVIDG